MKIVSLFDGMSCGQIALKELGVAVSEYHAFEIDKSAINTTMNNFPNTIQHGSVIGVDWSQFKDVDIVMGGSPCQSFSVSGKMKGMITTDGFNITTLDDYIKLYNDGVEFEGESYLFWEFVRAIEIIQPRYFLLENVVMTKDNEDIITNTMGVKPILINSKRISCQNRRRLYWTNIPNIKQPADRGVYVKDIIDDDYDKNLIIDEKYWDRSDIVDYFKRHQPLVINKLSLIYNIGDKNSQGQRVYAINGKTPTMSALGGGHGAKTGLYITHPPYATREVGRRLNVLGDARDDKNGSIVRGYEIRTDEKTSTLTTVIKDNYITQDFVIRRLSPRESARCQTIPEWYDFSGISNTNVYKMVGNGWTCEVVKHIFSYMDSGEPLIRFKDNETLVGLF